LDVINFTQSMHRETGSVEIGSSFRREKKPEGKRGKSLSKTKENLGNDRKTMVLLR